MPERPDGVTWGRQKAPQPGDPDWQAWCDHFLATLEETRSVVRATRAVGCSRTTVYRRRDQDAEFRQRWDAAIDQLLDELEDCALERATVGSKREVYHEGEHVGDQTVHHDSLAIFLLKCRRGYKEQSDAETPEEKARFIAELVRAMQDGGSSPPPDAGGDDGDR